MCSPVCAFTTVIGKADDFEMGQPFEFKQIDDAADNAVIRAVNDNALADDALFHQQPRHPPEWHAAQHEQGCARGDIDAGHAGRHRARRPQLCRGQPCQQQGNDEVIHAALASVGALSAKCRVAVARNTDQEIVDRQNDGGVHVQRFINPAVKNAVINRDCREESDNETDYIGCDAQSRQQVRREAHPPPPRLRRVLVQR